MRSSRIWVLAPALLLGTGAAAQEGAQPPAAVAAYLAKLPPLLDRELFFADPEYAAAQISPDGKQISFLQKNRGRMNIWVKEREAPLSSARPLTADTVRPVSSYFWSRDSKYILYVQDKGGDENYHLYAVDPAAAPGAQGVPPARDLTPYGGVRAEVIAIPRKTPGKILVGLNDRDPTKHDVYRIDLASGTRELVRQNDDNILAWSADQDGKLVLAQRMRDDGSSEILFIDGEYLAPFLRTCAPDRGCGVAQLSNDGSMAYVIDTPDNNDRTQLYQANVHGRMSEVLVARDPVKQADVTDVKYSEARDELDAVYFNGDRLRTYPLSGAFTEDNRVLAAKTRGDIRWGSATTDERFQMVSVSSDVDPGSVYLYDRGHNRLTLLYRSRPRLPSEALAEMKPVRYKARDGRTKILAYLTVPRGVEAKGLPTVVFPHGGPWARDSWGYNGYVQFLANRGYAVLQPNFRGSTGFGAAFIDAGNKEWGTGLMQHDISDGVKYLIDEGIADPKRIAIMGGSYGGYATLAGLAFTPDLYVAGVDLFGPSNLITLLRTTPPYWTAMRAMLNNRLGNADSASDAARLRAQSPLFAARQIRAPLLVYQGANDARVKPAESEQIVTALRDLGRPVEYLLAPDEGHGMAVWLNRMAVMTAVEQFLAPRLGGRVQESISPEVKQRLQLLRVDVRGLKAPAASAAVAPGN